MVKKIIARDSNFELLRITLILFVIILHYNLYGGVFSAFDEIPLGHRIFANLCEAFCICAVDTFVMLSGYFMYGRTCVNLRKVANLFLVVIIYSLVSYVIKAFLNNNFSWKTFLGAFVPHNYYAWLYSACYLLAPFINIMLSKITNKSFKLLMVLISILFFVLPSFLDLLGSKIGMNVSDLSTVSGDGYGGGYTLVNFCSVFCVGAFIKRFDIKLNRMLSLLLYLLSGILIFVTRYFNGHAYDYCNLFVVMEAFFIILFFKELKIQSSSVNFIAKSVWGIFVIHLTALLSLKEIFNKDFSSSSFLVFLLYGVLFVVLVFFVSLVFDLLLRIALKPIHLVLDKIYFINLDIKSEDNQ